MANCIIYDTGSDVIKMVILDAVRIKNRVTGAVSGNYISDKLKTGGVSIMWTNDTPQEIHQDINTPDGVISHFVGYDMNVSQITTVENSSAEIDEVPQSVVRDALIKRNDIAKISFAQLDAYIDNNVVDLSSAVVYLKKLSRVVLADIKLSDHLRE